MARQYAAANARGERISSLGRTSLDRRSRSSGRDGAADALLMDIRLSEVISALSYALDVTEGQPMGHAVRSCAIGMRIGEEIGLAPEERSSLFYALLLKDAGCSSNAARLSSLFGADDLELKRSAQADRPPPPGRVAAPRAAPRPHPPARRDRPQRRRRRARDDRAALRARRRHRAHDRAVGDDRARRSAASTSTGTAPATPTASPATRSRCSAASSASPRPPRCSSASAGPRAALDVAAERRGTWFDPQLVDALRSTRRDREFWASLGGLEPHRVIGAFEPEDRVQRADDERLDRVAEAFAMIIDAKSPYTGHHSEGVARIAVAIADVLGYGPRRAARPAPRRAAARHRQARRLQPDPRQAGQARPRTSGCRCAATRR